MGSPSGGVGGGASSGGSSSAGSSESGGSSSSSSNDSGSSGGSDFGDSVSSAGSSNDSGGSHSHGGNDDDGDHSTSQSSGPSSGPSSDPGLTSEQSASLAESAAVMDGFALSSAAAATPEALEPEKEEGFFDRVGDAIVDTGELVGGIAVGAGETAWDGVVGAADLAWEGVEMVNDAAGTVLDTAVGWTGVDLFEGHAQRNAERGQAIIDGITSVPELPGRIADSVSQGWETFEDNWETGNYYEAGKQIGGAGLEVATIAVPAAKAGALSKLGKVDDVAAAAPASGIVTRTADELPDTLFRGDSRSFAEIEDAAGFRPLGDATDLHDYALNNTPSVFVGTSPNVERAVEFATDFGKRDGYVYAVDPRKGGIDVNASLKADSPFPIEQEIAIPGGIPMEDIKGAWPVDRDGRFGPSSQLNDEYYGPRDRNNE